MKFWEGARLLGTAGKAQPVSFQSGQGELVRMWRLFSFFNIKMLTAKVPEHLGLMFQDKRFQILILKWIFLVEVFNLV